MSSRFMRPGRILPALVLATLCAFNASAYKVWLGTHKWEGVAADNLDQWDMAIDKIEGINYVLLDARADRPAGEGANTSDWRAMIAPIDQTIPGMAEIARSQYAPAHSRTLAERMENEFATARNNGGYEIDIIMLYDERASDGTLYTFDLADVQAVRAWLDSNGHADVTIVFRLTNYDQNRLALAQQSVVDGVLIEASATRWLTNPNNQHALLQDLWTDPSTSNKNIYFQIPRSESSYNQYEETRRALKKINELMGNDFMRSDQAIFIVCNYGDTFPTYPETASNDTLYVNSKSGIALSLIEQRPIFEGRTGVLDQNFCLSFNREIPVVDPGPTSGLVAHWPLDEGSGTNTLNAAGTPYTATLLNGASWGSDGVRNSYVSFDGVSNRIATTFTYALNATNHFTWAWWANKQSANGVGGGSIMVGNRYPERSSPKYGFIKLTPNEAQFANTGTTAGIEKYNYADVPQGGWHHYAMVKQGTNYQWYVDGVAQGSVSNFTYSESAPIPFLIGGDDDGSGTRTNEHFQGFIDDVVLYREALTPAEVADVKNGNYPYAPPVYELMAGWDAWVDAGGNVYHATVTNGATGVAIGTANTVGGTYPGWANWGGATAHNSGGSVDGTWGTETNHPPGAGTNATDAVGLLNNTPSGEMTFTITNTSGGTWDLAGFHFDGVRVRTSAANAWSLSILAGSAVTVGAVTNGTIVSDNSSPFLDREDVDVDLTGLSDRRLGNGEPVTLRLAWTGGSGANAGGNNTMIDNVALIGAHQPAPQPPLLGHSLNGGSLVLSWNGNGYKLQSRTNLTSGTWSDVPGGTVSPVNITPLLPAAFYRLTAQ